MCEYDTDIPCNTPVIKDDFITQVPVIIPIFGRKDATPEPLTSRSSK